MISMNNNQRSHHKHAQEKNKTKRKRAKRRWTAKMDFAFAGFEAWKMEMAFTPHKFSLAADRSKMGQLLNPKI